MTERLFYPASETHGMPARIARLEADVAERDAKIAAQDALIAQLLQDRDFRKRAVALTSPKIKPDVAKVELILLAESLGKHTFDDGHVALDHLATNGRLAERSGMSVDKVGGVVNNLKRVGLIHKSSEYTVVNRYGDEIDPARANIEQGDHPKKENHLTVKQDDPDEIQRRCEMASCIPTKRQIDAKEQRKAERATMAVVAKLRTMPCPVCGTIGELHIHCTSCGWKDADLPAKQEKAPRAKKSGRQRPPTDKQVRIAIAAGEHEAPDPMRLDQRPDEVVTRRVKMHEALMALSGKETAAPPPLDYRSYDDPGIEIVMPPDSCRTSTDKNANLAATLIKKRQLSDSAPPSSSNEVIE